MKNRHVHTQNSANDDASRLRALHAGQYLKSKQTGKCYEVGQNLVIFTSDYPHIHPKFILAHDIRHLMRKGELYHDECIPNVV